MDDTNLLRETLEVMGQHQRMPQDVRWVGSREGTVCISWEVFAEMAKDIEYDRRFGCVVISEELVVVGDDWWLERGYDGSEWWEFKGIPEKQEYTTPFMLISKDKGWAVKWIIRQIQ